MTVHFRFKHIAWLCVSVVLWTLPSCNKEEEVQAIEVEEAPASIVTANFSIAAVAREFVNEQDIQIFDLIPAKKSPLEWTPTPEQISEINKTRPLVFVAGKSPLWISSLEDKIKVVNLHQSESISYQATSHPDHASHIVEQVGQEIAQAFPELPINPSAKDFYLQIKEYEAKWAELAPLRQLPKGIVHGQIRPKEELGFIATLDMNYNILLEALEKQEEDDLVSKSSYEKGVLPILDKYCVKCHDEENQEGDLNFELYLTESKASLHPELWETVSQSLEIGQMPPIERRLKPSQEEKETVYAWTQSLVAKWDSGQMGDDPGKTTIHRINKNEYNYTIRDLFGLKIRPADNFPEEGGGEGGFDNNADTLYLPPLLVENYFEAASTVVQAVYSNAATRKRYLSSTPGPGVKPEQAAEKVLRKWAAQIYRKPPEKDEIERLVALFKIETAQKKQYNDAMKMPLFAMLISPNFLYRSTLTEEESKPYQLSDFELASKLSYFLWSSMPDAELFSVASKGELSKPSVLEAQVKRMLSDQKARALGMHLGGQWFGWEQLRSSTNPDTMRYPEFTFRLRVLFYQESTLFFNDLVKENGSVYNFLDSDYTFLNEELAKFYNIPGVTGRELRKVQLTDKNRGGVLGMGSVLASTSLPLRTSPSVRGAFVLKDMLGTPFPETPMNVEQLPDDDREIGAKSFRETMAQHREDPDCRSCHGLIDPIGFGLETFDAIGRVRTHQNGVELDTSGEMPNGKSFSSAIGMKKALLEEKEKFVRHLSEKMLSYALGRDLTAFDRSATKTIADKIIADDGSIQTALLEVVKSYPFQNRRSDNYKITLKN